MHKRRILCYFLIFSVIYTCCDVALAAEAAVEEMRKRARIREFAEQLGIDPKRILDPETPEERAERIREKRQRKIEELRSSICSTSTPEDRAAAQAEFDRVNRDYLPERVAALINTIQDLDKRLKKSRENLRVGKSALLSAKDLRPYSLATSYGLKDLEAAIRTSGERLESLGMPREIINRTLRFYKKVNAEITSLDKTLVQATSAESGQGSRLLSEGPLVDIGDSVTGCLQSIHAACWDTEDGSNARVPAKIEDGEAAGGSSAGGAGGGGSGGDGGMGSVLVSVRNILLKAAKAQPGAKSGVSGDPVDLGTGDFFVDEPDALLKTVGDGVGIVRRYNSNNPSLGPFGYGWRYNYGIHLVEDATGNVTFHRDDGREFYYEVLSATEFTQPGESDGALHREDSDFVMSVGKHYFLRFDDTGRFIERADKHGNMQILVFDQDKRLDRVENKDGLILLDLSWNAAGLIESASARGNQFFTYEYDGNSNLISVTNADGNMTEYTYYSDHRMASRTDGSGNTSLNYYDTHGRVHRQVDPDGGEQTYAYDLVNHMTVVTDPNGNRRSVRHDSEGHLEESTDAFGNRVYKTYDEKGRVTSETDEYSRVTSYEYYDDCEVCGANRIVYPDGVITENRYGRFGLEYSATSFPTGYVAAATRVFDASGNMIQYYSTATGPTFLKPGTSQETTETTRSPITTMQYDSLGRVLRETSEDGLLAAYQYDPVTGANTGRTYTGVDADGQPVSIERKYYHDERGFPTGYRFGEKHEIRAKTNARGLPIELSPTGSDARVSIEYAGGSRVQSITSAAGITYEFEFNGRGQPTYYEDQGLGSRHMSYDPAGNMVEEQDGQGNITRHEHNAIGQRVRTIDPRGYETDYLYCGTGTEPSAWVGPTGESLAHEFDFRQRPLETVDGLGNKTTFEYNLAAEPDRPSAIVDAEGNRTEFRYDTLGRLIAVQDAAGNITSYEYGPHSTQPTRVTDAEGKEWEYLYDPQGNLLREVNPLGDSIKYYYDGAGNLVRKVDADGSETVLEFDGWNRLIAGTYPDGATTEFIYENGLLVRESSSKHSYRYQYNSRGLRTKVEDEQLGQSLEYVYDKNHNVRQVTDSHGRRKQIIYDEAGNVIAIEFHDGKRQRYEYDETGRKKTAYAPNGVRTEYNYDDGGRLKSIIHFSPENLPFSGFTYTYDKVGNILTRRDHEGTIFSYKYDELNRLTEYRKAGQLQESYTYDKVGNLLTRTKLGELTELEYNAAHQLIAAKVFAGTTTYEYDGAGRLNKKTSPKGVTNYSYTQDDRLACVELPSGVKIEYEYSASGKYVARVADGERTERLLDNDHLHAEYHDGVFDRLYLTGAQTDEWIGMNPEGEDPVYFHQDHLNTITAQTGPYGSLQATREYSPFGEVLSDSGMDTNYGYTGRLLDSQSGLMQYRERWYSPTMSRFTTLDPMRGQIDDPASRHRYMYAMNNPIRYNDPSGLGLFADIFMSIPYAVTVSLASALLSCYSPMADFVLGLIDLFISTAAAMLDVVFTYRDVRGATCAVLTIMVLAIFALILIGIAAAKWTRCEGFWRGLGTKGLKTLLLEAAKYISMYASAYIVKKYKGSKTDNVVLQSLLNNMLNSILGMLKVLDFYAFFIGVFKMAMAPELCIGFCMLVFL